MERIVAARQRLGELPEPSNGPSGTESQVREAVQLLSSVLGDLETVAKESKREEEAVSENESRLEILAETPKDDIVSIDDQSTIRYPNPTAGRLFGYELDEMLWEHPYVSHARASPADSSKFCEEVSEHRPATRRLASCRTHRPAQERSRIPDRGVVWRSYP